MSLWKKILIGMIAGILTGLLLKQHASVFRPIGDLFISGIQMLIVPLVFCSLVAGITSMTDVRKMGRIGVKALFLYLLTSFVAVAIGLFLADLFKPGVGMNLPASVSNAALEPGQSVSILEILFKIIPPNPIEALASGNLLGIIFFAIVLGIAITLAGREGKPLKWLFNAGASAMYKMTSMVMSVAPYGVFALMAWLAGNHGIESLLTLMLVVATIYLGYLLLAFIIYIPLIWFTTHLSPKQFFKHVLDALLIAFTTSSSAASLPISMSCAQKNLGISKSISSFVLPLGSTINMNGAALYFGVAAVFIAQAFGLELSFLQYCLIGLTAVIGAIGSAGVPGAGIIILSMVLNAVGLPLEGIILVAAVDRIIDMGRTSFNVGGDLICALIVANSEGELDRDVFNQRDKMTQKDIKEIDRLEQEA